MAKRKRVEEGDGDEQQRNVKQCVDNDTSQKCLKKERKAKAGGPETSKNIVEEDHGHEKRSMKAKKFKSAAPETGTSVVEDDTSKTKLKRKEKGKSKPPETSTSVVKASEDDGSEKYYTKEGKATSIVPEKSTSAVGDNDISQKSMKKERKAKARGPETSKNVVEDISKTKLKETEEAKSKTLETSTTSVVDEDHGHEKRSMKSKKFKSAAPKMGTSAVEDDTFKTDLKRKEKGKSKTPEKCTSVVKASEDDASEKYYKKERKVKSIVFEKSTSAVEVYEDDTSETSLKKRKKAKSKTPETSTSVVEAKGCNSERIAKSNNLEVRTTKTAVECEPNKNHSLDQNESRLVKGDGVIIIKVDIETIIGRTLHLKDFKVNIKPEKKDISTTIAIPGIMIKFVGRELRISYDETKEHVKGDDDKAFKSDLPETFKIRVTRQVDGTKEIILHALFHIYYLPGWPDARLHPKANRSRSFPAKGIYDNNEPDDRIKVGRNMRYGDNVYRYEELGTNVEYLKKHLTPLDRSKKNTLALAAHIWSGHGRFLNASKEEYFDKIKDLHYRFGNIESDLYIGGILESRGILPGSTHKASDIYNTLYLVYRKHFRMCVRTDTRTNVNHLSNFLFGIDKYGEICSLSHAERFVGCWDDDEVYIDLEYDSSNGVKVDIGEWRKH